MKRVEPDIKQKKIELLAVAFFYILKNDQKLNYREFANNSDMEYSHFQKIMAGKNNPLFTTLLSLIETLNIPFSNFAKVYDELDETTILEYREYVKEQKTKRGKKNIE
jgi:transcriptional regulator with XRE-family HTH domain